jgi:hypothetical protein
MDKRKEVQNRAEQLYPYQLPSPAEDLLNRYGTAEDLEQWQAAEAEAAELIKAKQAVPPEINVTLNEVYTRAEHRFYEDTLRGDYDLFCALVRVTVERFTPESDVYGIMLGAENSTNNGFIMMLSLYMKPLLNAAQYFGWDKIRNSDGESYALELIMDRAEQLYPGTRAEYRERAEQLRHYEEHPEELFGDDLDRIQTGEAAMKPPGKEKKPKQVHIEALPAQALFALDNVSYQAFEGLLESADYGGQLQAVRMFTKSYKLPNGTRKPGKPVQVFAIMECKGADFSQPLDVIDGAILRGIYSLLDAGETRFTLSHVWNMIAGAGQRTNKNRIDDMCARVRRMIATTAKISYQQYAEETNMEYTDDITAQILPGVKIRERKNSRGEVVEAELFCQLPLESFPLYQFAVYSKQIDRLTIEEATVRGKDVDGKAQALTDYRLIIRELLLRRIKKHHNNKSDQVIRLEGLRDDPGLYDRVNATTTQQQIRARDTAENFLCEWIQLGTIYAYAWRKKGKTLDAILIANTPEEMENHPGAEWLRPKPEKQ